MQFTIEEYNGLVQSIREMTSNNEYKYNHHLHEHMMEEIKFHNKFQSWVKQSYPEVWESWKAIRDIEGGV